MSGDETIIGIDLGTTFSLVAYADARGVHVIPDENGEPRLPSVLGFAPDGSVTIGWEARRKAVEYAEHTVYSIKRLMGLGIDDIRQELPYLSYEVVPGERETIRVKIDGRHMTPQEISALILRELKRRAEAHFGHEVEKAVITVPAFFDDSQRQATRDAGRIAGLDVVRIINEPTAAALAYGIGVRGSPESASNADTRTGASKSLPIGDKSKCASSSDPVQSPSAICGQQTIAIYDLGGGTFDVSILRISDGVFEVLSTSGDTHLGGDDFDRAIIDLVKGEVHERFAVTIDAPVTRQALRDFSERMKIQLSERESAAIELDLGNWRTYQRTITRGEFEQLIAPLIDRTIACFRKALADAKLAVTALDHVVLVGGSTRIPLVRQRIEAFACRKPYTALNPDEVVALGAAVQGQILAGGRQDALLLDVTPLSLGIETMGGAMGKLIMRNTRIPCQATERFTTFMDGQTSVKIRVLQGERELAADCRTLAEFDLRGVPPMPAGIPKVDVHFLIDANGILNVSAREDRSGAEASIQVITFHGLTKEEVDRIADESVHFPREDMTAHRLIDLRNQVEFDTHKAEQMLARYGHLLPSEEREALETAMADLRAAAVSQRDADALHRQLDRFGKLTENLANLGIRETLREEIPLTK